MAISSQPDMAELAAEFGGATPHSLSEYYLGNLPANVVHPNTIPPSGAISLYDFIGAYVPQGFSAWVNYNGNGTGGGTEGQPDGYTFYYGGIVSSSNWSGGVYGGSQSFGSPLDNNSHVTTESGNYSGYFNQGLWETNIYPAGTWQPCGAAYYNATNNCTENAINNYGGGTYNAWNNGGASMYLTVTAMNALRMPWILMQLPSFDPVTLQNGDTVHPQWIRDMMVAIQQTGEEIPYVADEQRAQVRPALFLENVNTREAPNLVISKGELAGRPFTQEIKDRWGL